MNFGQRVTSSPQTDFIRQSKFSLQKPGEDPGRNLTRTQQKAHGRGYMGVALSVGLDKRDSFRHPDAILKVGGGPKFPNGEACPMVLLGGILF